MSVGAATDWHKVVVRETTIQNLVNALKGYSKSAGLPDLARKIEERCFSRATSLDGYKQLLMQSVNAVKRAQRSGGHTASSASTTGSPSVVSAQQFQAEVERIRPLAGAMEKLLQEVAAMLNAPDLKDDTRAAYQTSVRDLGKTLLWLKQADNKPHPASDVDTLHSAHKRAKVYADHTQQAASTPVPPAAAAHTPPRTTAPSSGKRSGGGGSSSDRNYAALLADFLDKVHKRYRKAEQDPTPATEAKMASLVAVTDRVAARMRHAVSVLGYAGLSKSRNTDASMFTAAAAGGGGGAGAGAGAGAAGRRTSSRGKRPRTSPRAAASASAAAGGAAAGAGGKRARR